jgi:hypothetical protein
VRSYVEPSVSKDWHKLDVKHVSGLGQWPTLQLVSKAWLGHKLIMLLALHSHQMHSRLQHSV